MDGEEGKEGKEKLLSVPGLSVPSKNKYSWNEKPIGISMGLCRAVRDENQVHLQRLVCRDSGSCREGSCEAWHSKGSVQPSLPKCSVISSKTHRKMSLLMLVRYLR